MFAASLALLNERVDESAAVLDVGGWARPLARADWVLDLMPYESRGMLGHDGDAAAERFDRDTWVTCDLCDREPWPFEDDRFDFAVCSHTLEDLRDPLWVCSELRRVARAGYIEVPSRLEEQAWNVQGPWVGWGHHHWLIDITGQAISFVFKPHILGGLPGSAFPAGFADALPAAERLQMLWWENSFDFGERLFYEPSELNRYLTGFVDANLHRAPRVGPARARRASGLPRRLLTRLRGAARGRSG
ncbi:MAG: class I SAM-dependent methyltransferase [Thermoleophilaceae bacterium]